MKSVLMLMSDNCTMNAYASILEKQSAGVVKVDNAVNGIDALRCNMFDCIVLELNRSNFASQMTFLKEAVNYISMKKVVVIIEKVKEGPMLGVQDYLNGIGVQDVYAKPMGLLFFEELMKRFDTSVLN
jgi:hypothetical protein